MISDVTIKRPVFATMMMLALVLFGIIGRELLPVRELPDIDAPVVTVTTVYPGANASVVEVEITEKLEEVLNSVEGIRTLRSTSRDQVSQITIEFKLSADINIAAQEVRDRVSRVRGELPDDAEEPLVVKEDADAQAVIWISLSSDTIDTLELTGLAENVLKDRLQTVDGVSSVIIGGEKRFAIRIELDPARMAALGVSVLDVERALANQNVELPSGRVEGPTRELSIEMRSQLKTAEEFNRLIIREDGATIVRLADIGLAREGVEDERAIARYNSRPAVGLGIVRQSGANTIEVAKGIQQELELLAPLIPDNVKVDIAYDESVYIEDSIYEVWETLGIAFLLVVIVIFVFLRNVRSTLIPSLAIPICVIATFALLYFCGFSINIITMLALVLAIGIVVDDAILVLENIYRHIEMGKNPMDAAYAAMGEIVFPIIATTAALVAVFFPLAFLTGVTGRVFIEFAVALCGSVVISAFVALVFTPVISARWLKPIEQEKHGRVFMFFERGFERMSNLYERSLAFFLRHRIFAMALAVITLIISAWFFLQLKKEFLPDEDKGRLLGVLVSPEGATSEYTDEMVRRMEGIAAEVPEIQGYFSAIALPFGGAPGDPKQGFMFMRMAPVRDRGMAEILGGPTGLNARFFTEIEGAIAFPINPNPITFGFSQPFELVLQYNDLRELDRVASEVEGKLREMGMLANVRSDFNLTRPELILDIDRDRAGVLGVSIQEISRTLQILFGGLDLSKVKLEAREYDVIVQLSREDRLTPDDLDTVYVRSDKGELIQLSNLVTYRAEGGPNSIFRYNRLRSASIQGTPIGVPLGTVLDAVQRDILPNLPAGFRYEWSGQSRELLDSGQDTLMMFILAVVLVYMVLASQFESLVHPLTVLVALPLAAIGAFGLLWMLDMVNNIGWMLYGMVNWMPDPPGWALALQPYVPRIPAMNLNLYSEIGMVLLIGLVTKNSILLVDFANQEMAKGHGTKEAMLRAGAIRLRPILMTAIATVAGIFPLVIGFGAGAESRRPMGVAIFGGMITSTFLTLIVVPVVYTLFGDLQEWLFGKRPVNQAQDEVEKK